jgi:hypothetical protein
VTDLDTHAAMGAALVERGLATAEQVATDRAALEAHLAGDTKPADPSATTATPQPAVQPSAEVNAITAAAFAGPAGPSEYRFESGPVDGKVDPAAMKFEQDMREFLHAEQVPVALAREMSRIAAAGGGKPMNDQQLQQGKADAMAQLGKAWGTERDANLATVRGELARMAKPRPEIMGILDRTPLGNSAWLAQTLLNMVKARRG